MYNPFALAALALEAQEVIGLRLVKLAWGGREAQTEAHHMVSEKVGASIEAAQTLMMGGSIDRVITRYREQVSANTERLGAAVGPRARYHNDFWPTFGAVTPEMNRGIRLVEVAALCYIVTSKRAGT
jgi:hypothetical protein